MIVAGFGYRAAATAESLRDALTRASDGRRVDRLAAPRDKAAAPCLTALACELGLSVLPIDADTLLRPDTPTQAPRVLQARGTGSVAEASALAGAGPGARLLCQRQISCDRLATCALAEGETP
ncbi:cobalt-precorrin 5A hydrolase [Salinihabitans flavidus]|uniref:Cobalt-precorrin 5A hydrolase n=2 Tax=Salinihabitans flavidus TaxID=569882 RepID=A0A1H8Q6A6_9RHOB|nr:cobalamin biosynthesis protein [Salinihabitans flavidus]SEO49447.1 cobalt-precorrin 5A hydrolase [Salinihabitans flavidus]